MKPRHLQSLVSRTGADIAAHFYAVDELAQQLKLPAEERFIGVEGTPTADKQIYGEISYHVAQIRKLEPIQKALKRAYKQAVEDTRP